MTTSLEDLTTQQTPDEVMTELLEVAADEGLPTTSWQSGSVIRTIFLIVATVISNLLSVIVEPIKGGFGDLLSSLGWAKVWAKQMYDVDHVGAEPATGYIDAVNASDNQFDLDPGDLIVAHATTNKTYRNTEAISIAPNATLEDIAIEAVEVGTSSNAAPGLITVVVGPSMDGVTVTNPLSVLGSDDEKIKPLVERSRAKLAALSPLGPKDAFNYIAKTPEFSATSAAITRSSTFADPLTGIVTCYIATAAGAPSGGDVDIVQAAFEEWAEPWCVDSVAVAASEVLVPVTYTVWVRSGLTESQIKTAIESAVAEYFADLPIGGTIIPPATTGQLYTDALIVSISSATLNDQLLGVVRATITLPAADLELDPDEVAILGAVTGTVHYLV